MADWPPLKNGAFTVTFPIYDADGDLVTAATTPDSEVSGDGATFADCTNEATELATGSGVYTLLLTAGEMNFDRVATITKTVTAGAKTAVNVMYTATRQLVDLAFPTVSGRGVDVTAAGEVGLDLDNTSGTLDAAQIGADAITNAKIAADAIGASEIANGAIDAATFAAGAIDAAAIATDAIDADALAADAVTEIRSYLNSTAQSGSTTTLVDTVLNQADTDWFNSYIVLFTSTTLAGQTALVTGFTPGTDTLTFAPAVTTAVATHAYELIPASAVNLQEWLGVAPNALISGAVDADVSAMQADVITAAAIAANAIGASEIAVGAIEADAFAAGAIDASAIAADAIGASEIAVGAIAADAFVAGAINDAALAADAFDGMFIRDMDQVEASAPVHSITSAILKAVGRVRDNAGTLETYQTDAVTVHMSQTVTTDAANDPIDELTGGV